MSDVGDKIILEDNGLDSWIYQMLRNDRIGLHTAMPGIIESFDETTQTAKVNLAIKRLLRGGDSIAIAPVINVPCVYPSAGGYSITFPVTSGDECLVVFSERAIDNWLIQGGQQEPSDKRIHDYNDAFAILGGKSFPSALSGYSTNSLQIRNNSGTTYINVTNDSIELEISGGGATFNADGSVIFKNGAQVTAGGDFVTAGGISLDNHVHGGVTTGPSSTGVAQ